MTKNSSEYFDQVASQWDTIRAGYFTEAVREAAIAKAYLRPEMVVADVGAGTGFMSAGLAALVQKVLVLDGAPAMLDEARKNLRQFKNVEFHLADSQALPLPDGSVDAAFANMYLHHCPDPLAAIFEMVRILKPGGRLVITDMDAHPYTWFKEEMADEWLGFERDQISSWFGEAGLVNNIVDCTGQSCCVESHAQEQKDVQGRSVTISVFLATGTRRINMRDAVQNAYAERAVSGGSCCGGSVDKEMDVMSLLSDDLSAITPAQSQCCCSSNNQYLPTEAVSFATGYSQDEKAAVPAEAEEISLGCGNPTALANLRSGEVVLDIGSGGGMDSFLAASRVGAFGKVIGVDMTPAMLERARAAATKAGILNVEFREGQAEALPTADSSVDVILSNCVINLCEDKGLVFREAYRVLKPGGRLEVSDMVTDQPLPLEMRGDHGEWAGCVSGALPEREYLDLVAQAGFTNISTRRSTSAGEENGIQIYSVVVSAVKATGSSCSQDSTQVQVETKSSGCCGS
jgi:ubiquinone/menaquinone biosynthesis C-methylase UbiE